LLQPHNELCTHFNITFKRDHGDLHVILTGDFDGSSAWQLFNILHEQYHGTEKVFIDTDRLGQIYPFGCSTLHCLLKQKLLPMNRLFFKGEKGDKIAPEGSKVIMAVPKHRCRSKADCDNAYRTGKQKT
jgi:hypothetical protein